MTREEQDKVLDALKYFRIHATKEQKEEALALLERDCQSDVIAKDYVIFRPVEHIRNWKKL